MTTYQFSWLKKKTKLWKKNPTVSMGQRCPEELIITAPLYPPLGCRSLTFHFLCKENAWRDSGGDGWTCSCPAALSSPAFLPQIYLLQWNSRRLKIEEEHVNCTVMSHAWLDKMGSDILGGQTSSFTYSVTGWKNWCGNSCAIFLCAKEGEKGAWNFLNTLSSVHSAVPKGKDKKAV